MLTGIKQRRLLKVKEILVSLLLEQGILKIEHITEGTECIVFVIELK